MSKTRSAHNSQQQKHGDPASSTRAVKSWASTIGVTRAVNVMKSHGTSLPELRRSSPSTTSSPSKPRKDKIDERARAWKAYMIGGEKNVQRTSLAPSLASFREERVVADKSMVDFFGAKFFTDDWFPPWLVKRPDFLKLCPRYCENTKTFAGILNEIPSDYLVGRALRHSKMMRDLDEPTIRSLTKKCLLSELPAGFVI